MERMSNEEIIKVVTVAQKGEQIQARGGELYDWTDVDSPSWDFWTYEYRAAPKPTNLEVLNQVLYDTFGVKDAFAKTRCPIVYFDNCDGDCGECQKWWDEPYREPVRRRG